MSYTQLINIYDDKCIVKISQSIEEDASFLESGFEYITDRDGYKIYRKPK